MDELEQYDLKLRESDAPDRMKIDFSIEDEHDNVCWVWGKSSDDVEVECDHPYQCIDWGDDDECGECELCGSQCQWHWEHNYDNGYKGSERVVHSWHRPEKVGGVIKKIITSDRI